MYEEDRPEAMHYERGFPLGFSATPPGTDKKRCVSCLPPFVIRLASGPSA